MVLGLMMVGGLGRFVWWLLDEVGDGAIEKDKWELVVG